MFRGMEDRLVFEIMNAWKSSWRVWRDAEKTSGFREGAASIRELPVLQFGIVHDSERWWSLSEH